MLTLHPEFKAKIIDSADVSSLNENARLPNIQREHDSGLSSQTMNFNRESLSRDDLKSAASFIRGDIPTNISKAQTSAVQPSREIRYNYARVNQGNHNLPVTESLANNIDRHSNTIKPPTAEQIRNGDIQLLQEQYRLCWDKTLSEVKQYRQQLEQLGFSGRGENDLNKIINEQSGTYCKGGRIMCFGVMNAGSLSDETLLRNLCEVSIKSKAYSCLENDTRKMLDVNPGGIMIMQLDRLDSKYLTPKGTPELFKDISLASGETSISLDPTNFNQRVVGVIDYRRYAELDKLTKELSTKIHELETPCDDPLIRQNRIDLYNNDVHPRFELAKRSTSLTILGDVIKMLT